MTNAQVLVLIANGENSGVEFKRDDVRPEQLAQEIVALANLHGGRLLLGVDDDGAIAGIRRSGLERRVVDTVFGRYVHPMIQPFYEEIRIDERRRVAMITVTEGTTKPYVVRHRGQEQVFVCMGSTSQLASREQQKRLFSAGGSTSNRCRSPAADCAISARNDSQTTSRAVLRLTTFRPRMQHGASACVTWASWSKTQVIM